MRPLCAVTVLRRNQRSRSAALARLLAAGVAVGALSGCVNTPAVLAQLDEARRQAAEAHVEFTKASEASNRAVMADTDESSTAAAAEARRARQIVEQRLTSLTATLTMLGYREDLGHLNGFASTFEEYRRLDDEILPLAAENTNLKAQRLSFGPAREAADAFRAAVDGAIRRAVPTSNCCAEAAALRARGWFDRKADGAGQPTGLAD